MLKIFKKGTKLLSSDVDTYMVKWYSASSSFSGSDFANIHPEYQAFINKEDAENFAESIKQAHKLIKDGDYNSRVDITKYNLRVYITKTENGL